MPETDVFGLGGTPPEDILGLDEELQEPTAEETETVAEETPSDERLRDERGRFVAQEAPEATEEIQEPEGEPLVEEEPEFPEPALDQAEVQQSEAAEDQAQTEEEVEEQPYLWAGKYKAPEELEKGYNESREMWRRAIEAKKAEEQRAYQAELREAELARMIQQVVPTLREAAERETQFHAFAEQYREQTGQYPQGYTGPPPGPAPIAPGDVNQIVEQRLAQERQQAYQEIQRLQEYQTTESAVMGFYQDHPEVEQRGPADNAITDARSVLDESPAWLARDEEVDMSDRGTLEVLYEASKRPALLEVLRLRGPDYFNTEAGLELARREAASLEGVAPQPTTQTSRPVPAGRQAAQRKPFAESAVTGAEAEEQVDENDPWEVIKRDFKNAKNTRSVFQFE